MKFFVVADFLFTLDSYIEVLSVGLHMRVSENLPVLFFKEMLHRCLHVGVGCINKDCKF